MESYKYGVHSMHLEPTERQQLFEAIKNKAVKCADRTHLCATIYPWILHLVREYADDRYTQLAVDSFKAEIYDFQRALSVYLSAMPFVVSLDSSPLDLERIRGEALEAAIEMAIDIASIEVHQISINFSAIMAHFVEDL